MCKSFEDRDPSSPETPTDETSCWSCATRYIPPGAGAGQLPGKTPPLQLRVNGQPAAVKPTPRHRGTLEPSLAAAVPFKNCFSRTAQIYPAIYPHQSCGSRPEQPQAAPGAPAVESRPPEVDKAPTSPDGLGTSHQCCYQRIKMRAGNCVGSSRINTRTSAESTGGRVISISLCFFQCFEQAPS